jgi:hypothetical protein
MDAKDFLRPRNENGEDNSQENVKEEKEIF